MDAKQTASPWKDTKDREHDRREKREAVLRVAAQAFCENGVRMTSLDEIAERLNVTKPTLYHYFRSKDEILAECVRIGLELIDKAIAGASGDGRTARDRLEAALHRYAEIMTMDFGMCITRIGEAELPPPSRKAFRAHKRKIDERIRNLIEEGVADGSISARDVRLTAFTVSGALNWIARWYDPDGPLKPHEIARSCVDVLFEGLAPREPTKPFEHARK
jgi:AcrR family transcriptional regulator